MRKLFVAELSVDPAKLQAIIHYDGLPITAQAICELIKANLSPPATSVSSRSGTES